MRPMIELIFGQRIFPHSLKRTETMCQRLLDQNLMAAVNPRRRSPIFPLSPKNRPLSSRRFGSITVPQPQPALHPAPVLQSLPVSLWMEVTFQSIFTTAGRSMRNIRSRTTDWKPSVAVMFLLPSHFGKTRLALLHWRNIGSPETAATMRRTSAKSSLHISSRTAWTARSSFFSRHRSATPKR